MRASGVLQGEGVGELVAGVPVATDSVATASDIERGASYLTLTTFQIINIYILNNNFATIIIIIVIIIIIIIIIITHNCMMLVMPTIV